MQLSRFTSTHNIPVLVKCLFKFFKTKNSTESCFSLVLLFFNAIPRIYDNIK